MGLQGGTLHCDWHPAPLKIFGFVQGVCFDQFILILKTFFLFITYFLLLPFSFNFLIFKKNWPTFLYQIKLNIFTHMSTDLASTHVGYVYAIESAAFPGFVKIGRTNNVKTRIEAINMSLPIHPYTIIACFPTTNALLAEKLVHEHFKSFSYKQDYFKVESEDRQRILDYFMKAFSAFVLDGSKIDREDSLSIGESASDDDC